MKKKILIDGNEADERAFDVPAGSSVQASELSTAMNERTKGNCASGSTTRKKPFRNGSSVSAWGWRS